MIGQRLEQWEDVGMPMAAAGGAPPPGFGSAPRGRPEDDEH